MIARPHQVERIFLVGGRRSGEVAIGSVLKAGQLTASGQVHFAHRRGGIAVVTKMRSESRDVGRQDGAFRRWTTGQQSDTARNADWILTAGRFEVSAAFDEAIERRRSARLPTAIFRPRREEAIAMLIAQ